MSLIDEKDGKPSKKQDTFFTVKVARPEAVYPR